MGGCTNCQHEGYCIPDDCELLKKKTAFCYPEDGRLQKQLPCLL